MTLNEILTRMQGVKGGGDRYTARCPAHEDHQNSLSVGVSDSGEKILLNCFAGCPTESIVEKLGLKMSDLNAPKEEPKPQKTGERVYDYRDAGGALLYHKTRVEYSNGKKNFFFTQPSGAKGVKGIKRVPYNLPAVVAADTVYFVEGEKCADSIINVGRVATTLDGGASSKWYPEYSEYFTGKAVIILPDNDEPGMKYAAMIKKNIPHARIVRLPGLPPKGDIYDWLTAGHTLDELDSLPESDDAPPANAEEEKEPKQSQAGILLNLVKGTGATFFHSDTNDLYAAIPVGKHMEVWPLDGKDFNTWLHGLYYRAEGRPVGNEAVGQAISVLSAEARFDNPEPVALATRVTERGGAFWYDLANSEWQAIEITPEGWSVHDNPPIMFNRFRHQAAHIIPHPGGDVYRILRHVNIKKGEILFVCWLVSCFVPDIPHPMPIFYGEKGAAKSTTCSFLKTLIDPSALETLTLQNDPRTLAVNLQQHWFLPFDNVSHVNEETSDTLCRAVSGSGIQQRKLFTNAEDTIFTFKRCLALNGINNVATRADLLDRSILIELERIPETDRRELTEIKSAFDADRPTILGGILDTLSKAMTIFPTVKLDKLPRMADFARWGYAIGEALGGKGQEFLDQYTENRSAQNTEAINADPVATLVVALMADRDKWDGRVSELLIQLTDIAYQNGINSRSKGFPAQPNHLSRRLRAIKSNLEAVGIAYENDGHGKRGTVVSLRVQNSSSPSSHRHKTSNINGLRGDDQVTVNDGGFLSSPLSSPEKPLWDTACDDGDGRDGKIATFTGSFEI